MYLWLIHVDVWQKPTQYYNPIFFSVKNKTKKYINTFVQSFHNIMEICGSQFQTTFFFQTTQYSGFLYF